MPLTDTPTLTAGLLAAGFLLLAAPLPAAAEERRLDRAIGGQTLGSELRQGDDQRRRHGDDRKRWQGDRDREYRHDGRGFERDRPGSWAPSVEVIVDGISNDNRRVPRNPQGGPDHCHQTRSESWSTSTPDCPEPTPPPRRKVWSSSP